MSAGTWVAFSFERLPVPEAIQRIWSYAFSEWSPSNPAYRHKHGSEMLRVGFEDKEADLASGELWLPVEKT